MQQLYQVIGSWFRVQGSKVIMLISIILCPIVWIGIFHPMGKICYSVRLMRNTLVREQLGHFNWELMNGEPLNLGFNNRPQDQQIVLNLFGL